MPVDTIHKDYSAYKSTWQRVRDAVDGQEAIKAGGETYLPRLNGQDDKSYNGYKSRAQYINYSGRTLDISLGQLFRKEPVISGIDEALLENINLSGQSFYYFSRSLASEVFKTNRVGVLVDYSVEAKTPYITMYRAEEIINWKTRIINGYNQLSLVVLYGQVEKETSDKFDTKLKDVWRVLAVDEQGYYVEDYERANTGSASDSIVRVNEFRPLMNGAYLDYIPFYFVTSNGDQVGVQKSPLLDFVNVNLGHYKNSADFENLLHWTGAKTVVTKGMGAKIVPIGGSFDLPVDGDAFFLEASSDSGLKDELRHKEEQMAVMGTAIISGKGRYVASAETSQRTSEGEYATLADIANALSDTMTAIMSLFNEWAGSSEEVAIEYNTDYELAEVDPNVLMQYMGAVQAGYMSWETFYYNMQRKELYPAGWTIEDEKKAIDEAQPVETIPEEPILNRDETNQDDEGAIA